MLLQKENFNENLDVTSSKKSALFHEGIYSSDQKFRIAMLKNITVTVLTRKAAVLCIIPYFYKILFNVIIPLRLGLTNGFIFR
jgi:hypothetical protein